MGIPAARRRRRRRRARRGLARARPAAPSAGVRRAGVSGRGLRAAGGLRDDDAGRGSLPTPRRNRPRAVSHPRGASLGPFPGVARNACRTAPTRSRSADARPAQARPRTPELRAAGGLPVRGGVRPSRLDLPRLYERPPGRGGLGSAHAEPVRVGSRLQPMRAFIADPVAVPSAATSATDTREGRAFPTL